MKAALGIAVLACGGTALAARTGSLPTAVQQRAHTIFSGVGVPPPAPEKSARVTPDGVTASAVPSPSPAPSRSVTPTASAATTLDLCRVWDAAGQDPPGKAVPAQTRRALAAAAGGVPEIDGFCAALLGTAAATPPPTTTPATPGTGRPSSPGKATNSGKATATPSHPGKGQGKQNGKSQSSGK